MVGDENKVDWDLHLPHVEFAYSNSVSVVSRLDVKEGLVGRLPRLPLTRALL